MKLINILIEVNENNEKKYIYTNNLSNEVNII